MSYIRHPYYIYSDGENMHFDMHAVVPEKVLNVLIYKLLLDNRLDELAERVKEGKQEIINWHLSSDPNWKSLRDPSYITRMESQEGEFIKSLLEKDG